MGRLVADFVDAPATSVAVSRDGNCVLVSTLNSVLRLLDKDTGELLCEYLGHTNKDYRVEAAFSYDDGLVVSGSESGDVCMWDLVEGELRHRLAAHPGSVVSTLAYHPAQHCLVTGAANGSVKTWAATAAAGPAAN
jgi:mitogen-activated protein kinase organizer 1